MEALVNMFEHDRSAARGLMGTRKLIVFKHNSKMGNAQVQDLFNLVKVEQKDASRSARDFGDYTITIKRDEVPQGITLLEM